MMIRKATHKAIYCFKCERPISVFRLIKKNAWCYKCAESLINFIKTKDGTLGKDIRLCSCCKKFKEIIYSEGLGKIDMWNFCGDCIEKYQPSLLPDCNRVNHLEVKN